VERQNDGKENILLVDDRPENLIALEEVLDGLGYNLFKATSGQEALHLVLKHRFDLILLDVQMPIMDGFEVAKLLRGNNESKEIPIIFITAINKDPQYVARGYELGAENYLFKPISPDDLRNKVETALKYHRYKKQMKLHDMRKAELQKKHRKS
jgi:CheY-like chemotaxis protein